MDIDYKEVLDYSVIKDVVKEKQTTVRYLSENTGIPPNRLSSIITGWVYPKSDAVAKIAWALKVPVSRIVRIKLDVDPKKAKWFEGKEAPYSPPEESTGKVSYFPLRALMTEYLEYINIAKDKDYTEKDLFDKIEPYRRRNGLITPVDKDAVRKSLIARGYDPDYKSKTERHYEAKGLPPETRTKLKNDRPLSMRTVYDICNFFGCSIDWVMSYK